MDNQTWRDTHTLFFNCISLRTNGLVNNPKFNYPGFLLLDFPAELEDDDSVADKENFVIEPFVALLAQKGMESTQVIAGGSSFENLKGANRIEFSKIWK